MDLSTLGIIMGGLSGLGLLVRQVRIGLRDRGDRMGLIYNPHIADSLVELRRAPSVSGLIARPRTSEERHSALPAQLSSGEEVRAYRS